MDSYLRKGEIKISFYTPRTIFSFFFGPCQLFFFNKYTMSLPNGQNSHLSQQEQETIKMMHSIMESCPVKTAMSGAAGRIIMKELKS